LGKIVWLCYASFLFPLIYLLIKLVFISKFVKKMIERFVITPILNKIVLILIKMISKLIVLELKDLECRALLRTFPAYYNVVYSAVLTPK